jgi:hypothetical protein
MAKTRKKNAAQKPGPQAPTGAWTPAMLLAALQQGTDEDRLEAVKKAGILDARGKLTKLYKNWGTKITRTPDAQDLEAEAPRRVRAGS